MNWKELESDWQGAEAGIDTGHELSRIKARERALASAIRRRDLVETLAAVFVMISFGIASWHQATAENWVSATAAGFLAIWGGVVVLALQWARSRLPSPSADYNVKQFLLAQRDALRAQHLLLSGILWWYIAPCGLGVLVFFIGIAGTGPLSLAYAALTIGVGSWIWLWTRQTVRTRFAPRISQIDRELDALETEYYR